jgi:hypothetical protein
MFGFIEKSQTYALIAIFCLLQGCNTELLTFQEAKNKKKMGRAFFRAYHL